MIEDIIVRLEKLNISTRTLVRVHKSLVNKGYLDLIKTNIKDPITGLYINEKLYHLNELEQAIIFTLQNHEIRLERNEVTLSRQGDEIEKIKKQMDMILRENRDLKDKMENNDIYEIQL